MDIMAVAHKCRENKLEMHRENGVYNFKIKIPVERDVGARTSINNRYAALAEMEEFDKYGGSGQFFQRQGSR